MLIKLKLAPLGGFTCGLLLCISLSLWFFAAPAAKADALTDLVALLSEMRGFQANFQQTSLDAEDTRLQTNSGKIAVQRPGKLYWHVDPPMEQLVISDGQQLWLYDPDLEQVTVQPVSGQIADTPALLLSGEVELLRASYRVLRLESDAKGQYFELQPLNPDSLFESLKLSFRDSTLVQMHIHDALGQRSSLDFSAIKLNPDLDVNLFRFTPPDGVDVIYQ